MQLESRPAMPKRGERDIGRQDFLRLGALAGGLGLVMGSTASCSSDKAASVTGKGGRPFPVRPVNVIVPWGTGGGSDQMVRTATRIAEEISDVDFVVQNIPGAAGISGLNEFMQQPADGYTLFESQLGVTVFQHLSGQAEPSLRQDFKPVALMQDAPSMFFKSEGNEAFTDFEGLVNYAQGKQTPVTVAAGSVGLSYDSVMIASAMKSAKVEYKQIPFDKSSERYSALKSGQVDLLFEQPGDVRSFLKSGDFKSVVSFTDDPVKGFEGVPTVGELGLNKALTFGFDRGFMYKDGTPDSIVNFIADLFKRVCETKKWRSFAETQLTTGECLGPRKYKDLVNRRARTYSRVAGSSQ